jgi:hypothetical protein
MRLASKEDVAGDVQRVDNLDLLVNDRDAETGGTPSNQMSPESAL